MGWWSPPHVHATWAILRKTYLSRDVVHIWACVTGKTIAARTFFNYQDICTCGAKHQHCEGRKIALLQIVFCKDRKGECAVLMIAGLRISALSQPPTAFTHKSVATPPSPTCPPPLGTNPSPLPLLPYPPSSPLPRVCPCPLTNAYYTGPVIHCDSHPTPSAHSLFRPV